MLAALAPLSSDMFMPALPEMEKQFGVDTSTVEMALSVTMMGMGVGQLLAGPVSDRFGRRLPLIAGMICFVLATVGSMLALNITIFLALRFLQGLSGAFGLVMSRAIARDVSSGAELTRFFSMLMLVGGLAPILAPVIGETLLVAMGWRKIFMALLIVGLIILASTIMFSETLPELMRTADLAASFKNFAVLLKDRYFFGHCLLQCAAMSAFFSYLTDSSFLFQDVYKIEPKHYTLMFSGLGTALVAAGAIPIVLAGKVKEIKMLAWSVYQALIGGAAFMICIFADAPIELAFLSLLVMVPTLAVSSSTGLSLLMRFHGKEAGSASAILGFTRMFVAGLVAPLTGIAGDDTAVPLAVIIFVCQLLATLIFVKMVLSFHRRGDRIIHGSAQ